MFKEDANLRKEFHQTWNDFIQALLATNSRSGRANIYLVHHHKAFYIWAQLSLYFFVNIFIYSIFLFCQIFWGRTLWVCAMSTTNKRLYILFDIFIFGPSFSQHHPVTICLNKAVSVTPLYLQKISGLNFVFKFWTSFTNSLQTPMTLVLKLKAYK